MSTPTSALATLETVLRRDRNLAVLADSHVHRAAREDMTGRGSPPSSANSPMRCFILSTRLWANSKPPSSGA